MRINKVNREKLSLAVVLGLIGVGFFTMLIGVLRSAPPAAVANEGNRAQVGTRSQESITSYRKPLTIHSVHFDARSDTGMSSEVDQYGVVVPVLPSLPNKPAAGRDPMADFMPIMPSRTAVRNASDAEGEDKDQRTGWGWLADDIAANRKPVDDKNGNSADENAAADEQNPSTMAEPPRNDWEDEAFRFGGMNFNTDREKEQKKEEARASSMRTGGDGEQTGDGKSSENEPSLDEWAQERNPDTGIGWGSRDPFASEPDAPRFGDSAWGFGNDDRGLGRAPDRSSEDEPAMSGITGLSSPGNRDEGGSDSVGGLGGSWGTSGSAWDYASDNAFNSGGGYTPRGVSASDSESLFSGAGVFGSESIFSSPALGSGSEGLSGGLPSLDRESGSGVSSASSMLEAGRLGEERQGPRALPW